MTINKFTFIKQLEKARAELWAAHNMATDNNEWHRAKFIQNALEDVDALLHIEKIDMNRSKAFWEGITPKRTGRNQ